jgi:hypothetical protein
LLAVEQFLFFPVASNVFVQRIFWYLTLEYFPECCVSFVSWLYFEVVFVSFLQPDFTSTLLCRVSRPWSLCLVTLIWCLFLECGPYSLISPDSTVI